MAHHIALQRDLPFSPWDPPGSRVALFFIVSGCVMVLSSRRWYGQPGGPAAFWRRRLARLLPLYWLSTLCLAAWLLLRNRLDLESLALSLAFVPHGSDPGGRPLPLNWPAWTLHYELLFYFLFGLFLPLGRAGTILATTLAIAALVALGMLVPPGWFALDVFTRPILVQFVAGMALGLALAQGRLHLSVVTRLALVAGAIGWIAFVPLEPAVAEVLTWRAVLSNLVPALLAAIALTGGALNLPRPLVVLGDISYGVFLWHLPVAMVWLFVFQMLAPRPGPWGFALSAMGLTLLVAWISYRRFELPLRDRLLGEGRTTV